MRSIVVGTVLMVVLGALATPAHAESESRFRIEKAEWKAEKNRLLVEGRARDDARVTITDAASGLSIGTASADDEGDWKLEIRSLASVPCRVRATSNGASAERSVEHAPRGCGSPVKTLSSLGIEGPSELPELSSASYRGLAAFSDGTTADVTDQVSWRVDTRAASIQNGVLTTTAVDRDWGATISASYSYGGTVRSVRKRVLIRDTAPRSVVSLGITGPAEVAEEDRATFTATAAFSDGSTTDVTGSSQWSVDSPLATITAGSLATAAVDADQQISISVSYTNDGATVSATRQVTIRDSSAPTPQGSHAGRITSFDGTSTCLKCHMTEALQVHASVHYQWQGDASETTGLDSSLAGKLGGINDFCIYPDINWIGTMTNLDGKQVDGGCAKCHAGLGAKPTTEPTIQQLENIDCLLCHSPSYRRKVGTVDGAFRFVPDESAMTVPLLQAAVDIHKPTSDTCLNCHTKAGGGNNFKRGDIEEAHRDAPRSLDVHMASRSRGGAGLECLDCHTTVAHRVAGRGVDLRPRELSTTVSCSNCHSSRPHGNSDLDRHTARVECTVCHVPEFAKVAATDMFRDWSAPGDVNPASRLYEPHMLMASHVRPEYRFFNGTSRFYQFGSRAVPGPSGRVEMAAPEGSITDSGAKILAFKRHLGKQPIDPSSERLLPLKIGIFFQTGDVGNAVAQGAGAVGWTYSGHSFADTERWMGLYHEVAPAEQALACGDCHGGSRLDFAALGYTPKQTRNGKPLCTSCHGKEDEDEGTGFLAIHRRHVTEKRLDCSNCHGFSRASN